METLCMNESTSTRHDFDFLFGAWTVRHRRLRERLAGCDDWQRFDGSSRAQPLLDGLGNVDDNVIELPGAPYRAATLRIFDESRRQWSIWWLDARHPQAPLDPPMVGGFDGQGNGLFFAEDQINGRPIRVRFRWLDTLGERPRWEQAFSTDAGQSWEVNWEMDFERVPVTA
jgi:hypothetical protein